ncbi:MAG: ClpXP protease specificity-enhancing factor [Candidatus Nitrotoga sp.]
MTRLSTLSPCGTKPYLIRAIYDWCCDSGLIPYLAIKVDAKTRVPVAYVKNGEIVINLGIDAVKDLHLGNDSISCHARFGGVSHAVMVPIDAVIGIFAKETGQGLVFQAGESSPASTDPTLISPAPTDSNSPQSNRPASTKPHLRIVK